MHAIKLQLQQKLPFWLLAGLVIAQSVAVAGTDKEMQEQLLKARVAKHEGMDHAAHVQQDETMGFHGIFYGYLPCQDCNGIKTTLSLKQNNNYLLVTQPARESSREFFEKGKYNWDEQTGNLTLTAAKDAGKKHYRIEDDSTLLQLDADGNPMLGNQDDFALRRSDSIKSRQVHIH